VRPEVVVELVVVLVLIVLPLILQVIARIRGQDMPPPPAQRPPPRPAQKPLEDEISEFLRRAAEGRRPPGGVPQRRAAPPTVTGRPVAPPARRPAEPPVTAQVVEPPVGGDIGRHVQKFLDADEFGRRSTEMGEGVVAADQAMDQRVSGVFEHSIGQFSGQESGRGAMAPGPQVRGEAVSPLVAELVSALSRPESVRQAIVINEILRRPEDRWASKNR